MTTKHSPLRVLRAQADKIAAALKAAERGDKVDARFAGKLAAAARAKDSFRIGVVMDDKTLILALLWATIRDTTEPALAEYIVRQMQEARDVAN